MLRNCSLHKVGQVQMMWESVPVVGVARAGLLAGGEGGKPLGSPIRVRKFGVRARPSVKSGVPKPW